MWFTDPSCKDVVTLAWSSTFHPDVVDNLLSWIANCSEELTRWNQKTFGHVGAKIRRLEAQLKHDHNAIS